jgi:hypothetical protein
MNSAGRGASKEVMKARASAGSKGSADRSTFFGLCLIGKIVSVQVRVRLGEENQVFGVLFPAQSIMPSATLVQLFRVSLNHVCRPVMEAPTKAYFTV